MEEKDICVWKTIKIGNYDHVNRLIGSIYGIKKVKIEKITEFEIESDRIQINKTEEYIDLVSLKISDLGFDNLTDYKSICNKANELGLNICPAEVGFQLLSQYKDDDYFFYNNHPLIAMEPRGKYDLIFRIKTDEKKKEVLLTTKSAKPYYLYPNWSMIFCLRKNNTTAYT